MLTDYLAYRTASRQVQAFASEGDEWIAHHAEVMECHDCDSFLQMAIDAFEWMMRADVQIRLASSAGKLEFDASVDAAFDELLRIWLKTSDSASAWISRQVERGFRLENLPQYRNCVEEVRAMLNPNYLLTDAMAALGDEAVAEFERGETLEWEVE